MMEIDMSKIRNYYETLSKNASELCSEITQIQSLESAMAEERFNAIVRDCEIFGNEIWTTISGLRNNTESKANADTEHANRINDDLRLLKARADYWTNAVYSWAQHEDRRQEHLAVHAGQHIKEIQSHVEIRNTQTEQALANQFHEELKNFEQRQRDKDHRR
jgi:hypothetical protein